MFEQTLALEEYLPQRAWYQYNDKLIPCVVTVINHVLVSSFSTECSWTDTV